MPKRQSKRLPGFDYSQEGLYFMTINIQKGIVAGEIRNGQCHLNDTGRMLDSAWQSLPERFPFLRIDECMIMPDHMHGIIEIVTGGIKPLGEIVGAFKSMTTVQYIHGIREYGWPRFNGRLWQRDFYDRIIRNRRELRTVRKYIQENPKNE